MESNLSCFHGSLCRDEAETILTEIKTTGAFLIRHSETILGSYTLCLWANDGYHQYRIINDAGFVYVKAEAGVEEPKYSNLNDLIDYYQSRESANGLAAPLKVPVPPRKEPDCLYDLKKNTDTKHILACYFQNKFRNDLNSKISSHFSNLLHKYLEYGGLVSDLEELESTTESPRQPQQPAQEMMNFQVLLEQSLKPVFEAVADALDNLQYLNQFFCISQEQIIEDHLNSNNRILQPNKNLTLFRNCDADDDDDETGDNNDGNLWSIFSQLPHLIDQLDLNVMSSFLSYLSTISIKKRKSKPINGCSKSAPDSTFTCESKLSSLQPISHIRIFELDMMESISSLLNNAECRVLVDLLSGKLKFELRQSKLGKISCHNIIDCESIIEIHKHSSHPNRAFLQENSTIGKIYIDFKVLGDRDQFIDCLCAARRMRQMNLTNSPDLLDNLSVFVGTWNMGFTNNPESLAQWLRCTGQGRPATANVGKYVPHDIYVVALQESTASQYWDSVIASTLSSCFNREFQLVATKSNTFPKTLIISIFCRSELRKHIKNITSDLINTGFANKCGNKGAVSISFTFQDASFCFINCHLASGAEKMKKREEEFRTILQKIQCSGGSNTSNSSGSSSPDIHVDLRSRHDFLFCTGDLNMRTGLEISEAIQLLKAGKVYSVLAADEMLRHHRGRSDSSFSGFNEPEIFHGPTYRFLKGSKDNLDPFKAKIGVKDRVNVPSWCDRVLYYTRHHDSVLPLSYGINQDYTSSDHKPVFSSFLLALPTRDYLMAINNIASDANFTRIQYPGYIRIEEILIKLDHRWKSKQNFHIQIQSPVLNATVTSKKPHIVCDSSDTTIYTNSPSKLKNLIKFLDLTNQIAVLFISPFKIILLRPGVSERDLDTNDLLVTVSVSDNKYECVAHCTIPLTRFSRDQLHSFELDLLEHGISVGSMTIQACLEQMPQSSDGEVVKVGQPRLTDFYKSTYFSKAHLPNNYGGILDLFNLSDLSLTNDNDMNSFISPSTVTSITLTNNVNNGPKLNNLSLEETSAFRPVQSGSNSEGVAAFPSPKILRSHTNGWSAREPPPPPPPHPLHQHHISTNNISLHQTLQHQPTLTSRINGINCSNSMRLMKSRDHQDYNERQNFSDDSSSTSKFCHTMLPCKLANKNPDISQQFSMDCCTIRKGGCQADEEQPLVAVHNESYSTAIIRGGVSNKKRHMDARVDLSKLEIPADSCSPPQPPLPPRTNGIGGGSIAKRNVRPARTRQEHSNPISMASSSGSSYNATADLSAFSADASLAIPLDSEFDNSSNEDHHDLQQTPHNRIANDRSVPSATTTMTLKGHPSVHEIERPTGQYVQAIHSINTHEVNTNASHNNISTNNFNNHNITSNKNLVEEKFIEPYASMKVGEHDESISSIPRSDLNDIEYVVLQKPVNLHQWLTSLQISDSSIQLLLSSPLTNHIDNLLNLKESELKSLGITDSCQRHKILVNITTLLQENNNINNNNNSNNSNSTLSNAQ